MVLHGLLGEHLRVSMLLLFKTLVPVIAFTPFFLFLFWDSCAYVTDLEIISHIFLRPFFFFKKCVCICVCTHVHVCHKVFVKVRGQPCLPLVWDRDSCSSPWTLNQLRTSSREFPCFFPFCRWSTGVPDMLRFKLSFSYVHSMCFMYSPQVFLCFTAVYHSFLSLC